jgi:predicted phage tail protein
MVNQNNPAYNTLSTVPQSQTSYTARFLAMDSTYSITVYAVDDRGHRSADSNTATARTLADTTPPSAPTLETTVLGPSQIRLTWTRSIDNIPLNCCSYLFYMNDVRVTEHLNWYSETSLIIRHLPPASTNTFRVTATDYRGNTSSSNASIATTEPSSDVTPPTAPTGLHLVRDQGCGEIYLGWTQATDDVDPQYAIEYEIYVNGVLSPLAVSAGVSEDFVYATAFGNNVFYVKAVDRTGNSSEPSKPITLQLWPC